MLAVDVGDLVHIAVLLGGEKDVDDLVVGDVVALAGLDGVVGEVADADAPVLGVAAAAVAAGSLGEGARAGARRVAVVLLEPVGEVLDVRGLVLVLDGLLDGDDVHPDAGTAGRDQLGHGLEREEGHALEEGADLGMLVELRLVHDSELSRAGHEHREYVLLGLGGVLPGVLDDALDGHRVEDRLEFLGGPARRLDELVHGHRLAPAHAPRDLGLLLGHDAGETPVVGVLARDLVTHAVGDLLRLAGDASFEGLARGGAGLVGIVRAVVRGLVVLDEALLGDDAVGTSGGVGQGDGVAHGELVVGEVAAHRRGSLVDAGAAVGPFGSGGLPLLGV